MHAFGSQCKGDDHSTFPLYIPFSAPFFFLFLVFFVFFCFLFFCGSYGYLSNQLGLNVLPEVDESNRTQIHRRR